MAPGGRRAEGERVGGRARIVPLPLRVVVRGCDELFGENGVFGRISRVFSIFTRCALRIAGAHQPGVKCVVGQRLWSKLSVRLCG